MSIISKIKNKIKILFSFLKRKNIIKTVSKIDQPNNKELINLDIKIEVDDINKFTENIWEKGFCFLGHKTPIQSLEEEFPEHKEKILASSSKIMNGELNYLGSGWINMKDKYGNIQWNKDITSEKYFPKDFFSNTWNPVEMCPKGADIKGPWEIARSHHLVTLAQAFCFTKDERYVQEIINQIIDFNEKNPIGIGVNWICTMDIAIRAVNWIITLEIIRVELKEFSEKLFRQITLIIEYLWKHGHFIFSNLENKYEVTSNHFLSNVLGLLYLGFLFEETEAGKQWLEFAIDSLEREIKIQVLPDGMNFESSIPYHRFVTELFLSGAVICSRGNKPLSYEYNYKLKKMLEFCLHVTRPDGLSPQVGDSDNGRLHEFLGHGMWNPQNHQHLIAPAALFFNKLEWFDYIDKEFIPEAFWWGFDIQGLITKLLFSNLREEHRMKFTFPYAGIYIARQGKNYCIITNSEVGTNGFGNHKHNDQLSFELFLNNIPIIVDPGSYVYTSNPEMRNKFRSVKYHNTLCIDNLEQNKFKDEWLFRTIKQGNQKTLYWEFNEEITLYLGEYDYLSHILVPFHVTLGEEREDKKKLGKKLKHQRMFILGKDNYLLIIDFVDSEKDRDLSWKFCCDPEIKVNMYSKGFILNYSETRIFMEIPDKITKKEILDEWYSPSYGIKLSANHIRLETKGKGFFTFKFYLNYIDNLKIYKKSNELNIFDESNRYKLYYFIY